MLVSLAVSLAAAFATSDPYSACLERSETNLAYSDCGRKAIEAAEAELGTVWKRAYASVGGDEARRRLLTEQRSWIRYKDSSCTYFWDESDYGSNGRVLTGPQCRVGVIRARTKQLEALIQEFKGPTD